MFILFSQFYHIVYPVWYLLTGIVLNNFYFSPFLTMFTRARLMMFTLKNNLYDAFDSATSRLDY